MSQQSSPNPIPADDAELEQRPRRRFGMVRWFLPDSLVPRTRQESAMKAGKLRRLPTAFMPLDGQDDDDVAHIRRDGDDAGGRP